MAENEKRRLSQLEEQLSDLMQVSDRVHHKMEEFIDYATENRKVVNDLLNRMDEREEEILKIQKRLEEGDKRWEALKKEGDEKSAADEKRWEALKKESDEKWDANEKRWEDLKKESDEKWNTNENRWEALKKESDEKSAASDKRWEELKKESDEKWNTN